MFRLLQIIIRQILKKIIFHKFFFFFLLLFRGERLFLSFNELPDDDSSRIEIRTALCTVLFVELCFTEFLFFLI